MSESSPAGIIISGERRRPAIRLSQRKYSFLKHCPWCFYSLIPDSGNWCLTSPQLFLAALIIIDIALTNSSFSFPIHYLQSSSHDDPFIFSPRRIFFFLLDLPFCVNFTIQWRPSKDQCASALDFSFFLHPSLFHKLSHVPSFLHLFPSYFCLFKGSLRKIVNGQ